MLNTTVQLVGPWIRVFKNEVTVISSSLHQTSHNGQVPKSFVKEVS